MAYYWSWRIFPPHWSYALLAKRLLLFHYNPDYRLRRRCSSNKCFSCTFTCVYIFGVLELGLVIAWLRQFVFSILARHCFGIDSSALANDLSNRLMKRNCIGRKRIFRSNHSSKNSMRVPTTYIQSHFHTPQLRHVLADGCTSFVEPRNGLILKLHIFASCVC